MAVTQNTYTGDNSTVLFSFTFPYLQESDVKVSLNGTLTTAYSLANATTVQFNTAPASGVAIRIYRDTENETPRAVFYPGSVIRAQDLNNNFDQVLYVTQESDNDAATATTIANAATATANTALSTAQTAESTSNTALSTANSAVSTANSAASTANTANTNATAAVNTANTANTNATTAVNTANSAAADAATAISTANSASSSASSAVSTANTALSTANTALSNSNAAVSTANTASANASAAVATANLAQESAENAVTIADIALNRSAESFGTLYNGTPGIPGAKSLDLGALSPGGGNDYFLGEDGGTPAYTCAVGTATINLGSLI